jgi:hypothetical protein
MKTHFTPANFPTTTALGSSPLLLCVTLENVLLKSIPLPQSGSPGATQLVPFAKAGLVLRADKCIVR